MKTPAPKSSKATPKTDALRKMREDKAAAAAFEASKAAKAPAPGKKKAAIA